MTDAVAAVLPSRRRIRGWIAFDWASQPFYTLCLTFVFGPYFTATVAQSLLADGLPEVAADARAQQVWSWALTGIGLAIALTAPLLGAMADRSGSRMRWIATFGAFYALGTAGLWAMTPDASAVTVTLLAFAVAMIGAEYTTIFTNAMLPSLAPRAEIGRISGTGYALGYAGGVLALLTFLLLFADDGDGTTILGGAPALGLDGATREGTRAVGPFTALWFVVFMIPFFVWVREPARAPQPVSLRLAWADVVALLRAVPGRRSLMAWLGGSMLYRDALASLYSFGGVYAVLVLDWETTQIGVFGILGAVTAAVASWIGGRLDGRHGPKPVIVGAVLILTGVVVVLAMTSRDAVLGVPLAPGSPAPDVLFYAVGAVIGGAGGVLQAASRTMMVRHADPDRATEAFGLYALSGKATAFLAPLLIGLATWATGSARLGILPVALLFLSGLALLRWVDPDGDR
ncbi:MFS transporter [Jannaschia sp. LMIT008]|uniref:MFS transporter n=1 Tax=Jannaschia maritima TaxID=3032585 RepID=UPI0028111CE3|nr:MFS transporter [Jannaschia sp. LMIT008]